MRRDDRHVRAAGMDAVRFLRRGQPDRPPEGPGVRPRQRAAAARRLRRPVGPRPLAELAALRLRVGGTSMRTAELNELDQLYLHLDRDDEPWSVHLEVRVDGALDEDA